MEVTDPMLPDVLRPPSGQELPEDSVGTSQGPEQREEERAEVGGWRMDVCSLIS